MKNRKIFIGWNGHDNFEIAQKVSNLLSAANYSPIVGGEKRESFTVSEEIIQQMNSCDFAIFLIEKEERKNKAGAVVSKGLNPNVMIELGYMLHRVSSPTRVRRILINMEPHELPSDLQGAWSESVEKRQYDENDEEEKHNVLTEVANKIFSDFTDYMLNFKETDNKLDYIDNWEENVQDIYKYSGDTRISDKLIYGMQAAIYSGDFDRLYNKLKTISSLVPQSEYSIIQCAMAILNVFVVTRRLTQIPTEEQFYELCEALDFEHERNIKDPDLREWCKIFRFDKLELCHELYAENPNNKNKKWHLNEALRLCFETLDKIDAQVERKKEDSFYALMYYAFINRNIEVIHKKLAEIEPEKAAEHTALQKEYCAKTLSNRTELYDYYRGSARSNTLAMDYISQEYFLALAEQYKFEEDEIKKSKISRTAKKIYNQWKDHNEIRNMIFGAVEKEALDFLAPQE